MLVDVPVTGLYAGVSEQPENVRQSGQMAEAINATFSVLWGGFTKRPGTRHVAKLTGLGTTPFDVAVYGYERDATEQYIILVKDGDLYVYDPDGNAKTVTFPNGKSYLNISGSSTQAAFRFVTVGDYTFIVNRGVTVDFTSAVSTGDYKKAVQTFEDLPTSGVVAGDIYKILGSSNDRFSAYYVKATGDSPEEKWVEGLYPGIKTTLDPAKMPHALIRQSDGTFIFQRINWGERVVGSLAVIPNPGFIGKTIQDISFHADRLCFVAGEEVFWSRAGDYFNFWPEKQAEILDTDPISRAASGSRVNRLRYIVPYRGALWATSEKEQFVATTDRQPVTPKTVLFAQTTRHDASSICRPKTMADALYFTSLSGTTTKVWEFAATPGAQTDNQQAAADITIHCPGLISGSVTDMEVDPSTNSLCVLASLKRSTMWVWTSFTTDEGRMQSAWTRWNYPSNYSIQGMVKINDWIYLVRWDTGGSGAFLEKTRLIDDREPISGDLKIVLQSGISEYAVPLDRCVEVTGVYNAGGDYTTWTVPYAHGDNVSVIRGGSFAEGSRGSPPGGTKSYPTTTTVRYTGRHDDGPCYIGVGYTMDVTFTTQYTRGDDGVTRTGGRTQIHRGIVTVDRSGACDVYIDPRDGQATRITRWEAGSATLAHADIPFRVNERNTNVDIRIVSVDPKPCRVTGFRWFGRYSEVSKENARYG